MRYLRSYITTNVQLKTRSHTCVHVLLTKTYLYPSLSYETHVWLTYFPITLTEKNVSTQLLTYKAVFLKNSLSWPTCLHASSSTKRGGDQSEHSILLRDLSLASCSNAGWARRDRWEGSEWLVVLRGQSFFMLSRLDRRGQSTSSLWSVVVVSCSS